MAPMTRYACTIDGRPTEKLKAYYARRAQNDLGLIIVESCAINSADSMGYAHGAQLHTQEQSKAWKEVVEEVHAAGAKIWVQLFHPGRLTVPEITGGRVLAPSALPPFQSSSFWRPKVGDQLVNFQTQTPYITPEEISIVDIQRIIREFSNACEMAILAGFDGIELHGAHGYLLHQFCHADSNHRTDEYRPSPNFKLVEEVVKAVKKEMNEETVLAYRLSVHMVDNSYIRFNSNNLDYTLLVKKLDEWGVDVFHSSELQATSVMFGEKRSLHELIREATNKPIIVCGGIDRLEKANNLLAEGAADLVAFGRNLISNPQLIKLLKEEKAFELEKFDYRKHIDILY